eukprot:TRINITY_DN13434_c0_g1_i4.p1 TRINITY_DN13434_c0_g1~~TRINITY_DN13434_c0_g1_i4.p1  ORF type:complete len:424 (-),score=73.88 TRINITY_DN13434_c0_g1_i4:156-1427(-)
MATPQGQDDAKAKKSKFQKADASILGFMGYKEEKASGGGKGKGGKGKGEGGEKGDSGGKGKKGQSKGDRKGGKGGKKGDRPKDPGEEQAAVPLPLAAPEQGAPQAQRRKDNWVPGMPPARESSQLKAQPKPKAAPVDASLTPAEMPPPGSPSAMPGAGSMPVNGALQPPRNNGGRYVPPNLRNKQGGKAEGPLSPNGQGLLFDRTSNGSSPFPGGMPPPPMPQQPLGRGPAMPPAAPTQPWQDGGMVPPPMGPPPMRPQVYPSADYGPGSAFQYYPAPQMMPYPMPPYVFMGSPGGCPGGCGAPAYGLGGVPGPISPEVRADKVTQARQQVDHYFSQNNLYGDLYLRRQMRPDGYVLISEIANFKLIKNITHGDETILMEAMSKSAVVEIDPTGKMVRPMSDPTYWPVVVGAQAQQPQAQEAF